jgi:hypothetical protein
VGYGELGVLGPESRGRLSRLLIGSPSQRGRGHGGGLVASLARIAFEDLGMEAIREFVVEDMPVTVAVDTNGESVHETGPREWRSRIGKIPVTVEA